MKQNSSAKRSGCKSFAIAFGAIVALMLLVMIFRGFFFSTYVVPTSSMNATLPTGSYILGTKLAYGGRITTTPLSIPFGPKHFPDWMPLFGGKHTFSTAWIWEPRRVPGLESIKRNHIITFNAPIVDTMTLEYGSAWPYYDIVLQAESQGVKNAKEFIKSEYSVHYYPIEKREIYVKRCIALPGDTLQIKSGSTYVNSIFTDTLKTLQFAYYLELNEAVRSPNYWMDERGISEYSQLPHLGNTANVYITEDFAKELSLDPEVDTIERIRLDSPMDFYNSRYTHYPHSPYFEWNSHNYGPIVIPFKGLSINLNAKNWDLYKRCIVSYESNNGFIDDKMQVFINDTLTTTYTFVKDYYWMMGDNRDRSQDSRFWGFVPEDHIIGKILFKD